MITISKATCRFTHASGHDVTALDNVSATIGEGEFVCLLGRSGHGKSTLLRSIAGLNALTSGTIAIDGRPISGPGAERSMVFQEDTVFPWMTVQQNVEFGLRAQNKPVDIRRKEAARWLEAVGLSRFNESWPKELSGGMRKRVAIASVFAGGGQTLLMDEPFGPLDYVTRRDLQSLLIDLWRSSGRTIIFVTHDIEEALILAERILVLRNGRIVDEISVNLPQPRDEEVRASPRGVEVSKAILRHLELETDRSHSQALEET